VPLTPAVGRPGGQRYDVARAIRTFLEQMASGGGFSFGGAVIKELIQNADDAGATELVVALDERKGERVPPECQAYGPLFEPALLIRNDAPFRLPEEVEVGDKDDFAAICEVAGGHKRLDPTAAGRFGIGFNSVYFLSDTPVLFSRREVHVFDLRRLMFPEDGWRFDLKDFPAAASSAGPIKAVLGMVLPKAILGDRSFEELASREVDYRQTTFRLPLRGTVVAESSSQRGPVFPGASFTNEGERIELLREMCCEARKALLFLKSLQRVVFGEIVEKHFYEWACVEATRQPSSELAAFANAVREMKNGFRQSRRVECSFRCNVSVRVPNEQLRVAPGHASFFVMHVADFTEPDLRALSDKLRKNDERAVPWVSLAFPLDASSFDWEGPGNARWRVFLPLTEEGPSCCILNAAVFVDPSRRAVEFRTDGSDETLRKSNWNRKLIERLLLPLLRDASTLVMDNAPELIERDPKKYLSLFPAAPSDDRPASSLTDIIRSSFASDQWLLRLYDIWKSPFVVELGPRGAEMYLEKVPESLSRYSGAFGELSTGQRRFVPWNVADAVDERLGDVGNVKITKLGADVADRILLADQCPKAKDLQALLKLSGKDRLDASSLEGRWALQQERDEGTILRFDSGCLYLVRTPRTPSVYGSLSTVGIHFDKVEWVASDVGLASLRVDLARDLDNIRDADETGALEMLRRVCDDRHDIVSDHHVVVPIVDFLCSLNANHLTENLRLAFMIKTAAGKLARRSLGVIFLRPEKPTPDEEDTWQGLLRHVFAEVDPQFAPHLRRLVGHAPQLLSCLNDDSCRVCPARGDLLDVLHDIRARDNTFVGYLAEQLNSSADRRSQVHQAARLLVLEAERRWDSMDESLRRTVLALPIHRTAGGNLISLLHDGEHSTDEVQTRYFLQSTDDLRDAPVELPSGQLLHSLDRDLRSFYRRRLNIRERGRVEVLKECLRQIGKDLNRSGGILKYLVRHYRDVVEQLGERGAQGVDDLRELEELRQAAHGVPCLDGNWYPAAACIDASQLRPVLVSQGFKGKDLNQLSYRLSYPHPVADTSSELGQVALALWSVAKLDRESVVELAITSESPNLPFADRIRVIAGNLKLLTEVPPPRAAVMGNELCEALGGTVTLSKLVLVEAQAIRLSKEVVAAVIPEAADLERLATKFNEGRTPAMVPVLRALSVGIIDAAEFHSRVTADFKAIWSTLGNRARLELLAWLAKNGRDQFLADQPTLDIVLVGEGNGTWTSPSGVIAPSWASATLPKVPLGSIPRTAEVPHTVLQLWDRLCGLRDLEGVVTFVIGAISEGPRERWPEAARRLSPWLDELVRQHGSDAVAGVLHNLPWVLARRRDEYAFRLSNDTVDHAGADILRNEFWVVAEKIPISLSPSVKTRRPTGVRNDLEMIAHCLASAPLTSFVAAQNVYKLLVDVTSETESNKIWDEIAQTSAVYRLFRSGEGQPDRLVSGEELFLGNQELNEDFGQVLYCFGSGDERKKSVRRLYRELGVHVQPDPKQLVSALSRLPSDTRDAETHSKLVDSLSRLSPDILEGVRLVDIRKMKVLSCAKTYEPLDHCYVDPELDRPNRLAECCRDRIVDNRVASNRKLLAWVDGSFPGAVSHLRQEAIAGLAQEIKPIEVVRANVLDAWRDWLGDLAQPGSVVRDEVESQGFAVPTESLQILIAAKIHVQFRLPDGSEVLPSEEWAGLEVFHDGRKTIIVRLDRVDQDFVGRADEVEKFDGDIADQVEMLLKLAAPGGVPPQSGALREAVRKTLDRPGALLKRMKAEKQDHFLHQYLDQTADPEFSHLFDEYRRISVSATEKRRLKEEEMLKLISQRFVDARRDQIRGYGYDEFAIFAELVQNAEDAYDSAVQLGLPAPPSRSVTFSYEVRDKGRTLTAAHYGRPFNLWRYGDRRIDAFRNDVEGVLKSAGSFKPHSAVDGARPIGRFGLGFKSVYLVTDAPRIHSGDWHFEITAGCIPNEIPIPPDYVRGATKIVLPLIAEAKEERDGERGSYAELLPFLRHIDMLRLEHSDGMQFDLHSAATHLRRTATDYEVDRVTLERIPGGTITFLRAKHSGHRGQLAILLASDGLPVAWSEAFDADIFAVLPLRAKLGCGVAVSNLFEIQSGRTHLINPTANVPRIEEVSKALRGIVMALLADETRSTGQVMARFWSVWQWDRGDEETEPLRLQLAKELVQLSGNIPMVPTLDPDCCVKLDGTALFSFEGIPDDLASKLIEQAVAFPAGGTKVRLQKTNVLAEPIRVAIFRAYAAAQNGGQLPLARIGWVDLRDVFLDMPWVEPQLVSAMARSLPQDKHGQVKPWLCRCRMRAVKGEPRLPNELLPLHFPGAQLLPLRLADQLHESYDEEAVSLLKQVGLPSRPPLEMMKSWVRSGLEENECRNLLRYLFEAGRWRRDYYDLAPLLTSQWFAANGALLTTAEAVRQGFVRIQDFEPDPAFRAWLGIETGQPVRIEPDAARWDRPVSDPTSALESIWDWWSKNSSNLVSKYQQRTYPDGCPPVLNAPFSARDHSQRENWLSLFILGALHTIGRTKPEQHRGFLDLCKRRGWMAVFADPKSSAERWIGVLDDYLDAQTNDSAFYQWVRQFVSIYQIARSLPEYVGSFLDIDKHDGHFDFDEVLKSRNADSQSGGGWEAPPLTRTLGIGACFVTRELVRSGVLRSRHAHDHAYVGIASVRNVFVRLGMADLGGESASYRHSSRIHRFLVDNLGVERAHFQRCFDLPFLAIAQDAGLQQEFLRCNLPPDED
jgi:hypothetical protein